MIYIANHMLRYNGKRYERGQEVPLTAKEAADLIKTRVVQAVGGSGETKPGVDAGAASAAPASAGIEAQAENIDTEAGSGDKAEYTAAGLNKLTKAQLIELAKSELSLELSMRSNAADLVKSILDAQGKE